ncbi:MAG: hypothetical protein ACYCPS_06480 [Candidatus Saccharimonadales bacterium]
MKLYSRAVRRNLVPGHPSPGAAFDRGILWGASSPLHAPVTKRVGLNAATVAVAKENRE